MGDISKTREAVYIMLDILKEEKTKVRHSELKKKVEQRGNFTAGHINGAFNQLREKNKSLNVEHIKSEGRAYFKWLDSGEGSEALDFRSEVLELSKAFLKHLNEFKVRISKNDDFNWLQDKISGVEKIFSED